MITPGMPNITVEITVAPNLFTSIQVAPGTTVGNALSQAGTAFQAAASDHEIRIRGDVVTTETVLDADCDIYLSKKVKGNEILAHS